MKPCFTSFCRAACLILTSLAAGSVSRPASAQSILHAQTQERLAAHVRLAPGATTLAGVLASLSTQTKLDIRAAPYLNAHGLTLQIEDASGLDVLNTLAELNGWRWYEREDKSIVVARQRVTAPPQIIGIPAMLQAAIPPDIRRYQDVNQWPASNTPAMRQSMASSSSGSIISKHVFQQGDEIARLLPDINNGKPVPYAKLTPEQQKPLLFLMFLADATINDDPMGYGVMQGSFNIFELDITKCQLYLQQEKYMYIGNIAEVGGIRSGSGFAAPLDYGHRQKPMPNQP